MTHSSTNKSQIASLCDTCQQIPCCTEFAMGLLFKSDISKIMPITDIDFVENIEINGEKWNALKTKSDSSECVFFKNGCSIYSHRPLECRMFPFDIYKINGIPTWIVYSCNPDSNWSWAEKNLRDLELDPVFPELLKKIEGFMDLGRIENDGHTFPHTVLRPVRHSQIKTDVG